MRKGRAVAAGLLVLAVTTGCKTITITPNGGLPPSTAPAPSTPGRADVLPAHTADKELPRRVRSTKAPRRAAKPVLARGSRGPRVRELQARLAQLSLFRRKPTGFYGRQTAASVSAFQHRRKLPRTGTLDRATWHALHACTRPPTRAETHPHTKKTAKKPTRKPAKKRVPRPDARCMTGRVLCISKRSNTLTWMVDGKVRSTMDVRFGAQYTPTREGTFRIAFKSRSHVSSIYHTPMPYAMFFSGGQAVHYSADFAAHGYQGASHGCVNVRNKTRIAALFQQVTPGDKVVIYK
ncbi:L,D-transpeptidase family protein [Streptomyces paromomycinus]|uniref:Lipoprotein n=1 Tax=Streptomyces paromomycinus TaxID=92743 RepID=A0A401W2F2_STREY|nr:L,D-transpeptidase family protein [Streptomyces paromomycinus]GCD43481.1 lipoprotein [Streptomyces paromomycinus]